MDVTIMCCLQKGGTAKYVSIRYILMGDNHLIALLDLWVHCCTVVLLSASTANSLYALRVIVKRAKWERSCEGTEGPWRLVSVILHFSVITQTVSCYLP